MSNLGWSYLSAEDKRNVLRGIEDGVAYGGPYHVEIYPADRCNIECFFCSTAAIRGTDELPFARFEELIDELAAAGTRSLRFAGGGEPLFHRKIKDVLARVVRSGIPIENITTNGVMLNAEIAALLTRCCDQVIFSLNTVGGESYAKMMQTPARNYERVLQNIRGLAAARTSRARPSIIIQFLVWKENYRSIHQMYALARELGADGILFNGLASLRPDQLMTKDERAEMLGLYEEVLRIDEYRTITSIASFERDITREIEEINTRITADRRRKGRLSHIRQLLARRDYTLREKIAHHRRMKETARVNQLSASFEESCVIGWYSLLVRSTGEIGPCCILQQKTLGNIFRQPLAEIWNGPRYASFRAELTSVMLARAAWTAGDEEIVESICARAVDACPIKSFYYRSDVPFGTSLQQIYSKLQQTRIAAQASGS